MDGGSWISFASEEISGQLNYKKFGKTVFLKISFSNDIVFSKNTNSLYLSYTGSGNTIYLPSAIRPSYQTNVFIIDNVHDTAVHARLLTDGRIQAWNNPNIDVTAITSWQADFCYRID